MGAGAVARRVPGDRRRQRFDRRLCRDRAPTSARRWCTRHRAASARPRTPACWPPHGRRRVLHGRRRLLDPAQLPRVTDPVPAGRADLVLGRRRPTGRGVAAARPAGQRRDRLAAAARGRRCRCTTSGRCGPPAVPSCWRSTCATGVSATRWRWSCGRPGRRLAHRSRSTSTTRPGRWRAVEGDRHRAWHAARGARHEPGAGRMSCRRCCWPRRRCRAGQDAALSTVHPGAGRDGGGRGDRGHGGGAAAAPVGHGPSSWRVTCRRRPAGRLGRSGATVSVSGWPPRSPTPPGRVWPRCWSAWTRRS